MPLVTAAISALLNVAIVGGLPFLGYFLFHRLRKKRRVAEIARRAGLQLGEPRYLGYSLAFALVVVAVLVIWPPPAEPMIRPGSAQHDFAGLGLSVTSVTMALLYGIVKTGFAEELLFRGLIAGSLSRRLSFMWANAAQALIFLLPHVPVAFIMPEMTWLLPVVFATALVAGWLRIKSGSIVGPWLIHATANVTMCLSVAVRTAG